MRRRRFVLVAAAALGAAAAFSTIDAQRPERQQEVKVPGIDVSLKAGWQLLFHERCRFAVPLSWQADEDASVASAPDGSNVSVRMFTIASWSAHRSQIKAAFGRVITVHDESDRRLWFEFGDAARVQHYVDVVRGLTVCSALVLVRPATTPDAQDTALTIVGSVGPAPDPWPAGPGR